MDNILVYTEYLSQPYVNVVCWVLEQLRKYSLFANLQKYHFHQDEMRFLEFVVFAQGINIEEERIEAVKVWLEPKSIKDIQVFLGFANFYRCFIQGFSKIAASLTSMLKTIPITGARVPPKAVNDSIFLTPEAKLAFSRLRQVFIKAPIFSIILI